jgi:PiT family inorganic phosphate transporter
VARSILIAWILTFPAAGVVAAGIYMLLTAVFQMP